jgi:hypothetical protein
MLLAMPMNSWREEGRNEIILESCSGKCTDSMQHFIVVIHQIFFLGLKLQEKAAKLLDINILNIIYLSTMFKKLIVVDAKGHLLGRLASYVAKALLSGRT